MRKNDDIAKRIENVKEDDFFGTQISDLMVYLPYEDAKQFLSDEGIKEYETGKSKWESKRPTRKNVLKEMTEYMNFALGKAEDHRGLSANRSIDHYRAWVWLLGDDDYEGIDWENYTNYGVPILKQICDKYSISFPNDNDCLVKMSQGEKCSFDCSGCGN